MDAQYCAKGSRPPSRIVVIFWDSDSRKVARAFEQELKGDVTLVPGSKGLYLEILSGHVHKGDGLLNLCHSLDTPLSKCLAIGDGDNDVEFLDMAGFGICMKNGDKQTKRVSDALTQWTNDEDGVVKAMQQLEALGMLQLDEDLIQNAANEYYSFLIISILLLCFYYWQ